MTRSFEMPRKVLSAISALLLLASTKAYAVPHHVQQQTLSIAQTHGVEVAHKVFMRDHDQVLTKLSPSDEQPMHLDVTSHGQVHLGRQKLRDALMRRVPEGELASQESMAHAVSAAAEANLLKEVGPFDGLFTTAKEPVRIGFAVAAFILAVVFIAITFSMCRKTLSRDELRKREEAAVKIQKRIRGHQVRKTAGKGPAKSRGPDVALEDVMSKRGSVLLKNDDITDRYRKLRPSVQDGEAERDYSSMVHTLSYDELAQVMNSKLNSGDNYKCISDPAGLREALGFSFSQFSFYSALE